MMTADVQRTFPANSTSPRPVQLKKQSHRALLAPLCSSACLFSSSLTLPVSALPKVYTVVDEMFLAGEIRETSQTKVLKQLLMLQSLE